MFKFINIFKHEVYFNLKDVNIKEHYETDSQADVAELCKVEGLLLVGSTEYLAWQKENEPKQETKKEGKKK